MTVGHSGRLAQQPDAGTKVTIPVTRVVDDFDQVLQTLSHTGFIPDQFRWHGANLLVADKLA